MINKCNIRMSLDEAITHCKDVVENLEKSGECSECICEHYQLLIWLEELKDLRNKTNKI